MDAKNTDIVKMKTGRFSLIALAKVTAIGAEIPNAPCKKPPPKPANQTNLCARTRER